MSDLPTTSDAFLQALMENKARVSVYLVNGIKLDGYIEGVDCHAIIMGGHTTQMIYKHAISTLMPITDRKREY